MGRHSVSYLGASFAGYDSLDSDEFGGWWGDLTSRAKSGYDRLRSLAGAAGDAARRKAAELEALAQSSRAEFQRRVDEEVAELEEKINQYHRERREFLRELDTLQKLNPSKAASIRAGYTTKADSILSAFRSATENIDSWAPHVPDRIMRLLRALRGDQFQGSARFGVADGGVISGPMAIALGVSVAVLLGIVAAGLLIRELQTGKVRVSEAIYQEHYEAGVERGLSPDAAHEAAEKARDAALKTGFDFNEALPWIFGISAAAIGLPYLFRTVKEIGE